MNKPKKVKREKYTKFLGVFLTETQQREILRSANSTGYSLSELIRDALIKSGLIRSNK